MSKTVAVLFSGGLDSTYLTYINLKNGNRVVPIYIEIENNENKTIIEKNHIKLLHQEFRKEFDKDSQYPLNIAEIEYVLNVGVRAYESDLSFKQVPIWMLGIVFSQGLKVDEIQIGYVSNDDAISYLSDIKKIYKSYQSIALNKLIPLVFPLAKHKKEFMAADLPKNYRDLIVTCEYPRYIGDKDAKIIEFEPCCECIPCRSIIASNYYGLHDFPANYINNLTMFYARKARTLGYTFHDNYGVDYYASKAACEVKKPEYVQLSFNFFDDDVMAEADANYKWIKKCSSCDGQELEMCDDKYSKNCSPSN